MHAAVFKRLSLLLAALAAVPWACSSFSESSEPSDGDAGLDGSTNGADTGPAADGGPGTDAEAAAPCTPPAFCDDFDIGALGARWTTSKASGGTLALDNTAVVSAPNSLLVAVAPSVAGNPAREATLTRTLSKARRIACSVSVNLAEAPTGTEHVFLLRLKTEGHPTASRYELVIEVKRQGSRLEERVTPGAGGAAATVSEPFPPLPLNTWVRLALDADFSTGRSTILVNDLPAVTLVHSTHVPTSESVSLGIFEIGLSGVAGWGARYDDFVCEVKP